MKTMFKRSKSIVIWCVVLCLLMPIATPILALANNDIPTMIVQDKEFELSTSPYENELGLMINAEDAARAFAYGYRFDSENKSFEIFADGYGKVTFMHNATKFYSEDNAIECLPYFYVENGIPMIEIGFLCRLLNSSYQYTKEDKSITLFKDIPQQYENAISMYNELDDGISLMANNSSSYTIDGEVKIPSDYEHYSNINIQFVVTPCNEPKTVWTCVYSSPMGSMYDRYEWVTEMKTGTPEYLGEVKLEKGENKKNFEYSIPESVISENLPYYVFSYIVSKDDSAKLNRYGTYKDNASTIKLGSSPKEGAVSYDAFLFDKNQNNTAIINIPVTGDNKPNTSNGYYGKNTSYLFSIRDYEKSSYYDENIFDITIGNEKWTTGKGGNVSVTPESLKGDFTVQADGYMPLKLSTDYLKKYFYNDFTMYKTSYSKKAEVHAVYCGSKNVFKTGEKQGFYIGDAITQTEIIPVINNNGKKLKNVKIVQGTTEIPVENLEYKDAGYVDGKQYQIVTGTTGKFAPGVKLGQKNVPIYVVVTTTFGETTKHKLNIELYEKLHDDVKLDLGEEVSFESPESDDNVLGAMSLKYKFFDKAPFSFTMTPDGNGNYGIKGTIGLDSLVSEDETKSYETVKDAFKAAARETYTDNNYDAKNTIKKFDNFFKKLTDEGLTSSDHLPSAEMGLKCSLKLFGYVDGSYDLQSDNTYKLNLAEGGISTKLEFGEEIVRQTYIPTSAGPIPAYWTAGLEFADALNIPLVGENGKLVIPDSVNNEFEVTIKGGGGVGIADLATCGASGEGKLAITCTIPLSKDTLEAIVSGKINLFDFKLGVLQGTLFPINTPQLMLYPDFGVIPTNELMLASEPQQLSRTYAEDELVFNVESVQLMSLGDEETSITNSTVATNTYTFSKPQLIEDSDGKLLLVWIEDERSRESDADRTAIYYSSYSNGVWSEPKIVHNDTTADFNPKLEKINNTIYLTWANATENFEADESDTSKIAKSLATSVAKWNGTEFDVMTTLNNQSAIISDITEIGGVPTIVWTENTTGDLNQTEKTIVVKSAQLIDEEWSVNELLNNQAAIDGICAVENSGSLYIYYSQDTDDDVTTIKDKEIFVFSNGSATQITDDEIADTKPVIVNDILYWYSDSQIAYKGINSDDISYVDAGCLSDSFNVSDNGSEKSIVFSSYNDDGEQTVVAICNDGEGWGKPIEVFASGNLIGGYNSAYCTDGLLRIVSNEILLQDNTFGEASINLYEVSEFYDIAVDNLIYDEYSANSNELWLYCDITNKGTSTVKELKIEIYDEDDSLLTTSYEDVLLLPGDTYTLSTACYGHKGEKVKVKVTPYPWNVEDSNLTDNTAETSVYKADISVEKMSFENADEKTIISGYVFNRGVEDISSVSVRLRKDSSTGEIIETATTNTIKPGAFEYVEFELANATDGLYYITCDEIENENLIGNNTNFLRYSEAAIVVKGDILSDGAINSKDAVKLAQYLAKWDITLTPGEQQAADVVADGAINSKDAVKLAQYLAKWDITLD